MPIIYMPNDNESSLENEPYASFKRKFDIIKENLNNKKIELELWQGRKQNFLNGFYVEDPIYLKNYILSFNFVKVPKGSIGDESRVLVRMEFCYEIVNDNFIDYLRKSNSAIRKRAPYFFIKDVEFLEVSAGVEDEYNKLTFDAIVADNLEIIENTCYGLINQLIAICSTEF
jgi:hypothetical protein